MARFVALFFLVLGVSGLQNQALEQLNALKERSMQQTQSVSVETATDTVQKLEKYLESFEKRDLKDKAVYQEYLTVRDGAKRAAEILVSSKKAFPPAPTDWANDDDELEVEDMEAEKIEAAQLKAKMEEEQEDDIAEEAKHEERKEQRKLKLKNKKLHLKKTKPMSEEQKDKVRNLQKKFSSPYRAASKQPEQEPEVVDEGVGTYGKYQKQIYDSSMLELPPVGYVSEKTLEDLEHLKAQNAEWDRKYGSLIKASQQRTKAQLRERDMEMMDDIKRHEHAKLMAGHAHQLCGDKKMCNYRVDQKLQNGDYDRWLAKQTNMRYRLGGTPAHIPLYKMMPHRGTLTHSRVPKNAPSYIH